MANGSSRGTGAIGSISRSQRGSRWGSDFETMTVADYEKSWIEEQIKDRKKIEDAVNKYRFEQQKKYNKKLSDEEISAYRETQKRKQAIDKALEDIGRQKQEKQAEKERLKSIIDNSKALLKSGAISKEELALAKKQYRASTSMLEKFGKLTESINKLSGFVDKYIDTYAKYQSTINTRLQGTGRQFQGASGIENILTRAIGVNPYVSNKAVMDNVQKLTEAGIAYNLEQRAFLETISDDIASTFSAFDSSLLRIIRLQQQDSTASRLGLEVTMTKYLNSMFQNTEYLNQTYKQVSANILEATATMGTAAGVEFEYVVQKWLGSLVSLGLSESTATGIASAIGSLGSGDISSLSSSGIGQLLLLSATRSGQDLGTIATQGLTATSTNAILSSMVSYLAELASSPSNIVKSSYASTFGLNVSDLRAISNVGSSLSDITREMLSYSGSLANLQESWQTVASRKSVADMVNTLFENAQFSLSSGIAQNPATLALWKITGMLEDSVGGIPIPMTGTSVSNIMRAALMGYSSLGLIGDIISGLGTTFDLPSVFSKLNILSPQMVQRGKGLGGNETLTESYRALIYAGSGEDIYSSAKEQQEAEIRTYETETSATEINEKITSINENVQKIYDLLYGVVSGSQSLNVRFDNFISPTL